MIPFPAVLFSEPPSIFLFATAVIFAGRFATGRCDMKDTPHNTMATLLIALERSDKEHLKPCATALLRSTIGHLGFPCNQARPFHGMAMATLRSLGRKVAR